MKGEEGGSRDNRLILVVVFIVIFFSVFGFIYFPFGDAEGWAHSHKYQEGDEVVLWVNKVGPFQNPQETYPFYSLPFCPPTKIIESTHEGLGEALQGYELIKSNIEIHFRVSEANKKICTVKLSEEDSNKFVKAITHHYWYQLFFDDLPIWGMVGEPYKNNKDGGDTVQSFIFTHKKFSISWNGDRVIEVNLTSENPVVVAPGASIDFTYSVNWVETDTRFDDRFNKYLDKSFFQHQIHWFSIFNSSMMVIFLVCVVLMILMRTLKRDAKFNRDDPDDIADDHGWKQIPGDVFRSPSHLSLFSALVGTGHQLTVLVFSVLSLAILGTYYSERGTVVTAFIVCYSLTSFIAGYGGGGYYARNGGTKWIQTMILTATIFPSICFTIAFLLNFIALSYKSLNYIPFSTMVVVLAIWIFIACPLTLIGTVVGKNWNGQSSHQKRIRQVPRPIPEKPWYSHRIVHIVLGGVLPFGSIFIEMYFIFTSFYKYYYVYGFMLLVYVILIIVTVCVTIVSTYFLLNGEDYRWQWTSFLSAASTAGYVYLYAVYYYFVKTKMSGFFQTVFYFGYMAMFCSGLAFLCGAVGFIGTSIFVHEIYGMIKSI